MPKNQSLQRAKTDIYDEFYTRYEDIEREMNSYLEYNPDVFRDKTILLPCDDPEWSNFTKYFAQNFENFGIKKLISTSYAADSKPTEIPYQPTLFEVESPKFDKEKTRSHGKIFVLERDINKDKKININDLEWDYYCISDISSYLYYIIEWCMRRRKVMKRYIFTNYREQSIAYF